MSATAVAGRRERGRDGPSQPASLSGDVGAASQAADPDRRIFLFLAELGVLALALGTVASLNRLFEGWTFLGSLGVPVTICWLSSLTMRRMRVPTWLAVVVSLALAVVVLTLQFAPGSSAVGLPTGRTIDAIGTLLSDSFGSFSRLVAPVPVTDGFLVVTAAALWLFGLFADTAVFRYSSPVQAAIPYGAAFVAIGVLAREANRISAAVFFLLGLLTYAVTQRALRASEQRWIRSETSRGATAVGSAAALLATVSLVVGLAASALLPGSTDAVLDLRQLGQPGDARTVISPFVGVRSQLGPQSDAVMFDVEASVGSYWRLTSLERYDEQRSIWVSEGTYSRSDGNLSDVAEGAKPVTQRFTVDALGTIWLPAAFEPKTVSDSSVSVSYDTDSSSLIARGVSLEPGTTYTIQSVLPDLDAAAVSGTAEGPNLEPIYHDEVDLAPEVDQLTQTIVAGAPSAYDKAIALQNYFRQNFQYDQTVNYSDAADPVAAFLNVKRGFCQQFSSTFALMARSLGMAARVAVGFTPGDPLDPAEAAASGQPVPAGKVDFVVRGRHAHAWPEIYFDHVGWVPFEPTPGRGNPQSSAYTGVEPQQAPPPADQAATTTLLTTSTLTPGADNPSNPDDVRSDDLPRPNGSLADASGPDVTGRWLFLLVGVVAALVLAVAIGRSVLRARQRAHLRHDPHGGRVAASWELAVSWLALIGLRPGTAETPFEFSRRAGAILSTRELDNLAAAETRRRFGADDPTPEDAEQAEQAASKVAERVRAGTSRAQQLRRLVR